MMHKAWSSIEEVSFCFSRSSVKFQGHTAKKWSNLTQIGRFRTVTPVWIHQWLRNYAKAWNSIEEMSYYFSRSYVELQGHTALKIVEFDPDWSFPDCNSILNSPMAPKWCTKLAVTLTRCPIVFFKVIRQISRSHGSKNRQIWPRWGVSGL